MPLALLLPGMDGTGDLFREFAQLLPREVDARVLRYPSDEFLTYEELADRIRCEIPADEPYWITAESYSGPIAALLAARAAGNLRAVVFVSTFVSRPCGRLGAWVARLIPAAAFRARPPAWLLRWFLADSEAQPELIAEIQDAIAQVNPSVLARRMRAALTADCSEALSACTARVICLCPSRDRLLGSHGEREILARRDVEVAKIAGPHLLLQCAPAECVAALERLGL